MLSHIRKNENEAKFANILFQAIKDLTIEARLNQPAVVWLHIEKENS